MTKTVRCGRLRGRIDLAIVTIRDDEYEAVLKRFTPHINVVDGVQFYRYCEFRRPDGAVLHVAVTRSLQQGHSFAQSVARTAIDDLEPKWLALVGIAGGVPDDDYTLGDVMLADSLHDFSVNAAFEVGSSALRTSGGPVHPTIERLLAALPSWKEELGEWYSVDRIGLCRPQVTIPATIDAECYYGDDAIRRKVQSSLQKHFDGAGRRQTPIFAIGALATSNTLVKDTKLLHQWRQAARHLTHIEMEAGGVYVAVRHSRRQEIPLLSIRGLSDIVGFNRSPEWTEFACHTAASFLAALVSIVPLNIIRRQSQLNLNSPILLSKVPLWRRVLQSSEVVLDRGLTLAAEIFSAKVRSPTVESIVAAFARSSLPLESKVVNASDWLPRPESEFLKHFLDKPTAKIVCITGEPGSGKTALLARWLRDARKLGFVTLGIKSDVLPVETGFEAWGRHSIGLEISAFDAVRVASTNSKVLVIIDQLDALASSVDLRSGRLNDVLRFIQDCVELPQVFVVASCRTLDYSRDTRFSTLNAEVM